MVRWKSVLFTAAIISWTIIITTTLLKLGISDIHNQLLATLQRVNNGRNLGVGGHSNSQPQRHLNWPHAKSALDWVLENLKPPAPKNYPLTLTRRRSENKDFSQFGQMPVVIEKYLKHRKNGIFLEVGAFDGERLSNTLQLEREYNWTGVLIEPDLANFQALIKKRRKVWALNACLSDVREPEKKIFDFYGPLGRFYQWNNTSKIMMTHATTATVKNYVQIAPDSEQRLITCVPISSILQALNFTHLHFLSLDTEGSEPDILKSFPWDIVNVDVIMVECNQCNLPKLKSIDYVQKKPFLDSFMHTVGYDKVDYLQLDYIYMKKRK